MWTIGDRVMTDVGVGTIVGLTVGGGANVAVDSFLPNPAWLSMGAERILYVIEPGTGATAETVFSPEQLVSHQAAVNGSATVVAAPQTAVPSIQRQVTVMLTEGVDLRDVSSLDPSIEGESSGEGSIGLLATAMLLLRGFMRSPGAITSATWNMLPTWAKAVLIQGGIGIGSFIAIDAFGGGDDEVSPGPVSPSPNLPVVSPPGGGGAHVDSFGMHLSSPIVGSWNTNPSNPAMGQTFYRLMDGKLAVMNKKGRWKVWKPKKPVVLYSGGTKNLKTLLKADAIITKEAKKLRKMLDRRAPRAKRASTPKVIAVTGGSVPALPIHHA